jgi:hypothetical protein
MYTQEEDKAMHVDLYASKPHYPKSHNYEPRSEQYAVSTDESRLPFTRGMSMNARCLRPDECACCLLHELVRLQRIRRQLSDGN